MISFEFLPMVVYTYRVYVQYRLQNFFLFYYHLLFLLSGAVQ